VEVGFTGDSTAHQRCGGSNADTTCVIACFFSQRLTPLMPDTARAQYVCARSILNGSLLLRVVKNDSQHMTRAGVEGGNTMAELCSVVATRSLNRAQLVREDDGVAAVHTNHMRP
jgi:hypothetical protein